MEEETSGEIASVLINAETTADPSTSDPIPLPANPLDIINELERTVTPLEAPLPQESAEEFVIDESPATNEADEGISIPPLEPEDLQSVPAAHRSEASTNTPLDAESLTTNPFADNGQSPSQGYPYSHLTSLQNPSTKPTMWTRRRSRHRPLNCWIHCSVNVAPQLAFRSPPAPRSLRAV